jgi:hypothetical protein
MLVSYKQKLDFINSNWEATNWGFYFKPIFGEKMQSKQHKAGFNFIAFRKDANPNSYF